MWGQNMQPIHLWKLPGEPWSIKGSWLKCVYTWLCKSRHFQLLSIHKLLVMITETQFYKWAPWSPLKNVCVSTHLSCWSPGPGERGNLPSHTGSWLWSAQQTEMCSWNWTAAEWTSSGAGPAAGYELLKSKHPFTPIMWTRQTLKKWKN